MKVMELDERLDYYRSYRIMLSAEEVQVLGVLAKYLDLTIEETIKTCMEIGMEV